MAFRLWLFGQVRHLHIFSSVAIYSQPDIREDIFCMIFGFAAE